MKRKSGFTIIEFLIVIAMIGILASIGIPNYLTWRANTLTREAAQQFARDVERLRTEVKRSNVAMGVEVTSGEQSYTLDDREVSLPGGVEVYRVLDDGTVVANTSFTFSPPYATADLKRRDFELRWISDPDIQRTVTVVGVTGKVIVR